MHVKLTKISYIRVLFKVRFLQNSVLFRVCFQKVSLYKREVKMLTHPQNKVNIKG
jgi:hypothetical protein